MKNNIKRIVVTALFLWLLPFHAFAAKELTPVGQVIGLELRDGSVRVAAFDEAAGSACLQAGMETGDILRAIDGQDIHSAEDVQKALSRSGGTVTIRVERNGKLKEFQVAPQITAAGPRLGVYLRQGVTGIGTVTWYDSTDGTFATLGHGVNNARGKLLDMTEGNAYEARVLAVRKGKSGEPGQLMGALESAQSIGKLTANTAQGVFGTSSRRWEGEVTPIASASEIRTGSAKILATVSGTQPREYSVEILKIYPKSRQTGRNLLIRVTDPALLETTGGIVQGMSGSPILQDGKLIGAVTHVLVNDPTTGYGIFIENMLNAAA